METTPASPTAAAPAARFGAAPALLLLVAAWALLRKLQLILGAGGYGTDVGSYFRYAAAWASGGAPYGDYQLEYPPGALPIFLAPLLIAGQVHYVKAFIAEMACFDLAALLMVRALARRLWPGSPQRRLLACGGYLAATALLHPVLYSRFDLAPATLTLAALTLGGTPWGAVLLGAAGAMKLWPLALAPLWLALAFRKGGARAALPQGAFLLLGALAPTLLVLPRAGTGSLAFLGYHAARGLQIESVWATLGLLLSGTPRMVDEFGAYHLRCGALCDAMAAFSAPALVLLALAPQILALRSKAPLDLQAILRTAAAAVLGVLVGSNVLSPQFLLWVVPLLVLAGSSALVLAAVGLAAGTSLLYPALYPELIEAGRPGHFVAVLVLVLRNLGLVATYGALLRRPRPARPAD